MAADDPEISVRPEALLIEELMVLLDEGRLRVPRFPRPFVWRSQQILELFDSIERGYPIGSLLFWETDEQFDTFDIIGDLPLPTPPPGAPVSYVLDGHQRLAALYGTLRRPPPDLRSPEQDDFMWSAYRVLGEAKGALRYQLWKNANPPSNYLPLRATLRTRDFLAFSRKLFGDPPEGMDADQLIREAEVVAQRIRSYRVSVVRLVGGDLSNAVEVFTRINTAGQAMRPSDMVSALTYRAGQPSLAEHLDTVTEQVAATGFGELSSNVVFRALLAIAGEDQSHGTRWDKLARHVQGELRGFVEATEEALIRAVIFLRDVVRVPLAGLIPYDDQLMLLITFFHHRPDPDRRQLEELTRWFWVTSWSGYFAGAGTTQMNKAISNMRSLAKGGGGITPRGVRARPFPDRFDLRSARVRAFVIWDLRQFPNRLARDGTELNGVDVLARGLSTAYRSIVRIGDRFITASPANRIMMTAEPGESVKDVLLNLPNDLRDDVLTSHGIPKKAMYRLVAGDDEGFLIIRRAFLAERERAFMARFGLAATPGDGETDIDTE
ncbi:DUF262 domain-containing protein [Actinomadura sp. 6K520]|uniref:DUF262 domain-containing protein n=1 Tax=Actinomadura sp. 6K520 TaxID=2530364 RepID=UPI0014044DB6|nr:DUF262 domain-containing protein [Actinomadura sp. 6K520]